jgi:hypothetical protein
VLENFLLTVTFQQKDFAKIAAAGLINWCVAAGGSHVWTSMPTVQ